MSNYGRSRHVTSEKPLVQMCAADEGSRLMQRQQSTPFSLVQKCDECLRARPSPFGTENAPASVGGTHLSFQVQMKALAYETIARALNAFRRVLPDTFELPVLLKCIRIGLQQLLGHCNS